MGQLQNTEAALPAASADITDIQTLRKRLPQPYSSETGVSEETSDPLSLLHAPKAFFAASRELIQTEIGAALGTSKEGVIIDEGIPGEDTKPLDPNHPEFQIVGLSEALDGEYILRVRGGIDEKGTPRLSIEPYELSDHAPKGVAERIDGAVEKIQKCLGKILVSPEDSVLEARTFLDPRTAFPTLRGGYKDSITDWVGDFAGWLATPLPVLGGIALATFAAQFGTEPAQWWALFLGLGGLLGTICSLSAKIDHINNRNTLRKTLLRLEEEPLLEMRASLLTPIGDKEFKILEENSVSQYLPRRKDCLEALKILEKSFAQSGFTTFIRYDETGYPSSIRTDKDFFKKHLNLLRETTAERLVDLNVNPVEREKERSFLESIEEAQSRFSKRRW